jgi:hypothetical protein
MAERGGANSEVLQTWFYPREHYVGGQLQAAPLDAIEKAVELRSNWLLKFPNGLPIVPMVKLNPAVEEGVEGWKVQTVFVYKFAVNPKPI